MIKVDIINEVAKAADITKVRAEVAVEAVLEAMKDSLMKGERIELRGFGVFQVKPRKRGIGRNPRTGKEVRIPPGRTIRFKPGKDLQSFAPVSRETDEPRVGSPSWPGGPRDTSVPPELMPDYGWLRLPPMALPPPSAWQRWGRNLALFLLTAASVFSVGGLHEEGGLSVSAGVRLDRSACSSILVAHEMGHYVAARLHGVDVTLPFFVPFPLPVLQPGRNARRLHPHPRPDPNRRALFDIGVAGPLAGFLVALPVLWLGILEATVQPPSTGGGGIFLGTPLLFRWFECLFRAPVPESLNLVIGPLGLAAWFGLLVTALNLMPIGQLDGGHVTYALLPRARSPDLARSLRGSASALIYFGPSWILWAVLMRVLGRRHPPTLDDETPVGPRPRRRWALLSLVVFVAVLRARPDRGVLARILQATPLRRFLP